MRDDNPTRTEIDEQLDDAVNDSWMLADYEYSEGQYETARLTIELEYDSATIDTEPPSEDAKRSNTLKQVVRRLAGPGGKGAPIQDVYETMAEEHGIGQEKTESLLAGMKNRGDVYEPQRDHIRVV